MSAAPLTVSDKPQNRIIAMFTPTQASEMLQIPQSTLRRYANQFASQLSESANKARGRLYTEADIALLAQARELLNNGKSLKEAAQLLTIVSEEQTPNSVLALIPSISQALTEALDTARSLRTQVSELSSRLQSNEMQIAELSKKLEAIEREHAKPWYLKIFRR